jgi:hypothetical protein
MSSAIIIVRYQLSKAGIATALRHGRNCDRNQTIVLQSPDYEAPKPPQDALEEIVGGVSGVEAPQGAEAATAVLNKMIEVTQSLAKALNPFASDDVIVEQADDEIWEIACEMASTNRGQTPFINIHDDDHDRNDFAYWHRNVGYELSVAKDRPNPYKATVSVKPVRHGDGCAIDAPASAAAMLPREKARRDGLAILFEQIEQQQAERVIELDAELKAKLQADALEKAVAALGDDETASSTWRALRSSDYDHLPEVAALKAAVVAGVVTPTVWGGCSELSEADSAVSKAMKQAKDEAKCHDMAAWADQHGSKRLQRMFADGMDAKSVYEAERLAHDLPGWKAIDGYGSTPKAPFNPTDEQYDHFDRAVETFSEFAPELRCSTFENRNSSSNMPVVNHLGKTLWLPMPPPSSDDVPSGLVADIEALNDTQLAKLSGHIVFLLEQRASEEG